MTGLLIGATGAIGFCIVGIAATAVGAAGFGGSCGAGVTGFAAAGAWTGTTGFGATAGCTAGCTIGWRIVTAGGTTTAGRAGDDCGISIDLAGTGATGLVATGAGAGVAFAVAMVPVGLTTSSVLTGTLVAILSAEATNSFSVSVFGLIASLAELVLISTLTGALLSSISSIFFDISSRAFSRFGSLIGWSTRSPLVLRRPPSSIAAVGMTTGACSKFTGFSPFCTAGCCGIGAIGAAVAVGAVGATCCACGCGKGACGCTGVAVWSCGKVAGSWPIVTGVMAAAALPVGVEVAFSVLIFACASVLGLSPSTSCTAATTSSIPTWDLTRWRCAPKASLRWRCSSLESAVIMITLILLVSGVDLKMSNMSKPEIFGIITSAMMRSGFSCTARPRASSPSPAETML